MTDPSVKKCNLAHTWRWIWMSRIYNQEEEEEKWQIAVDN